MVDPELSQLVDEKNQVTRPAKSHGSGVAFRRASGFAFRTPRREILPGLETEKNVFRLDFGLVPVTDFYGFFFDFDISVLKVLTGIFKISFEIIFKLWVLEW